MINWEIFSTDALVKAYNTIRKRWREMEWPADDVWPCEKLFDNISRELHRRGYFS